MNKLCNRCLEVKNIELFYRDKNYSDGRESCCKSCRKLRVNKEKAKFRQRNYVSKNKDKVENNRLLKGYNISLDTLKEIILLQNGNCAVCGNKLDKKFYIDHNHITGKVRGLLHNRCNIGVSYIEDNKFLSEVLRYLKKFEELEN